MVASGLVDVPEVSHIRLAIHLLPALLIFAAIIWIALDLSALAATRRAARADADARHLGACLLFLQFLFGAYVAGLDAGYAFNTWPQMGDEFFPAATPMLEPGRATSPTTRSSSSSSIAGSPSSSPAWDLGRPARLAARRRVDGGS